MTEMLGSLPAAGTFGIWSLVAVAVLTLIKGWPALRKMGLDADGSLRSDLMGRIEHLERETTELHRQVLVLYGALSATMGHLPDGSPALRRAENALRQTFPTISQGDPPT